MVNSLSAGKEWVSLASGVYAVCWRHTLSQEAKSQTGKAGMISRLSPVSFCMELPT